MLKHDYNYEMDYYILRVLLISTLRIIVKKFINKNFILKIRVFTFLLSIITQLFDANLIILVV